MNVSLLFYLSCISFIIGNNLSFVNRKNLDLFETVISDYVQSWCSKNGFNVPSDAELNDGVTEIIAYSRKLLKKKSSI